MESGAFAEKLARRANRETAEMSRERSGRKREKAGENEGKIGKKREGMAHQRVFGRICEVRSGLALQPPGALLVPPRLFRPCRLRLEQA
eukprot:4447300-Pleurochrysis_carterae.AAC.3